MVSGPANFAGESATRCQPKKFPGQKTPRESRKIANSEKEKKCSIKSSNFCLPHEQEYWKRRKRLFSSEKERDWTRQLWTAAVRSDIRGVRRLKSCSVYLSMSTLACWLIFSPYARHWRLWRDVMSTYFEVLPVRRSETH
jgi:hypothetical protein